MSTSQRNIVIVVVGLVVLVVALFGGVFFWLLDLFLLWLTTRITGQGSL